MILDSRVLSDSFVSVLSQGYRMRLHKEGKALDGTIDPVFPFDVNLYPLVGYVEQYLWPSVLFKCLAKLKGDYSKVCNMPF